MKKLLILLFGIVLLGGCSQKITMTTLDGSKSKTVKYKGDLVIKDGRLWFQTKSGTRQAPPIDMYDYTVKNGKENWYTWYMSKDKE